MPVVLMAAEKGSVEGPADLTNYSQLVFPHLRRKTVKPEGRGEPGLTYLVSPNHMHTTYARRRRGTIRKLITSPFSGS